MIHYEKTHHVHCAESSEEIRSVIYDPNGNALTHGELCTLINTLQDDVQSLKGTLQNIVDYRNDSDAPSTDYRLGHDGLLERIQHLAQLGLSAVGGEG